MKKRLSVMMICIMILITGCSGMEFSLQKKENILKSATELLEAQKYEEAVAKFEEAIAQGDKTGDAYKGIGFARYETGEYEQALDAFETALKNNTEKTPEIYHLMGICDMQLEDYQSALNNFNLGITIAGQAQEDHSSIVQEMKFNEIVCYEKLLDWKNASAKAQEYAAQYPEDEKGQKEAQFLRTR